jgi:hypothetical protein
MTRQAEVDIEELKTHVRVLHAAIEAISERLSVFETLAVNNAAIEGDEIAPRARNGKIKKSDR